VARVALLCPDLLFGSKLEGGLRAGGHEVTPFSGAGDLPDADVLVVDLTSDAKERAALVESMRADGRLDAVHTLGFYSHVEQDTRRLADAAGFDLVVPRSRMAREMAALVDRLAAA
jgi:hypothetical protein